MLNKFVKLILFSNFYGEVPLLFSPHSILLFLVSNSPPEIDLFDDDGGRWASIPDVLLLPVPELLSCRA